MSLNREDNGLTTISVQQTTSTLDIFNSLRIPDAIKDLPKYDGNPGLLHEFITNVEEILLHIRESLAIALDYCISEQNINYLQTDTTRSKWSKYRTYTRNGPYNKQGYYNSKHNDNSKIYGQSDNTQGGRFQRTNDYNNRPNWRQQQPPREEYGNSNMTQHPNNPNRQNNWERSQPYPKPMDTSSGFSNFNENSGRSKTSTSTRYSKVPNRNEVNNINEFRSQNCTCQHHDETYRVYTNLDQYDSHNFDEERDFRKSASNDKQGTYMSISMEVYCPTYIFPLHSAEILNF